MRIRLTIPGVCRGNTLMVTIAVVALVGLALATYLQLTSSQNQLTVRSQVWNACMPVLEAGIEEAMSHAQTNYRTNMLSNGWALQNAAYCKSNRIGDGFYLVKISQTLPYEIVSSGYLPMPGSSAYISRTVKVRTQPQGHFFGALIMRNSIKMNGNNILSDSYDSKDPNKNTDGKYDPAKAGDHGDVGCASGLTNAFAVGNAKIHGKILTGPTGGIKIGPNGTVGSDAWHDSGSSGVEPGWRYNDLNVDFPAVQVPYSSGTVATGGTVGGTNYNYVLESGNYESSTLSGDVLVTGNATLYVSGDVAFSSTDQLIIAPGASLTLYVAGASTKIGAIINDNSDPQSFRYYGLPTNKTLAISGNSSLTACIYAPDAEVNFNGDVDVYGSVVGMEASLNGNAAFHYDESLSRVPPARQVVIESWNEIRSWNEI